MYPNLNAVSRGVRRISRSLGPLDGQGRPFFRFMQDWRVFFRGVRNGTFPDYRPMAEFVHGLISDHLPVIGQVDW
jgi:hypothetical protein